MQIEISIAMSGMCRPTVGAMAEADAGDTLLH